MDTPRAGSARAVSGLQTSQLGYESWSGQKREAAKQKGGKQEGKGYLIRDRALNRGGKLS